jgi:hypothetical protein
VDSLVAFFDILGTKELVKRGEFSDFHSLDFANPVGVMALHYPQIRFAAFSDSVVVSCKPEDAKDLLSVLNLVYTNWFADFIFVRGGLAFGEIRWVDQLSVDKHFKNAKNFACARLYGPALVEAHELQEKSGPGMVCFVSEAASRVLQDAISNVVLAGPTNVLVWPTAREIAHLCKALELLLKDASYPGEFRRHIRATKEYMTAMEKGGLALPMELSMNERAKAASQGKGGGAGFN